MNDTVVTSHLLLLRKNMSHRKKLVARQVFEKFYKPKTKVANCLHFFKRLFRMRKYEIKSTKGTSRTIRNEKKLN